MLRVVSMIHSNMAGNAKIVIWARSACNEVLFGHFLDAGIAGTSCNVKTFLLSLEFGYHDWLWDNGLLLWWHSLSGAGDDIAVLDETLDHPVIVRLAGNSIVDTSLAKIEVTTSASTTVVVHIRNGLMTVIAEYGENTDGCGDWCSYSRGVAKSLTSS